jgi:ribosomal protein S18 acetylase RimI-like enzyme
VTLRIEVIDEPSDDVLAAMHRLVPQLSTSATPMTRAELTEITSSAATDLFVAFDEDGIVGTLTLVIFRTPGGTRAWIEDVITDESKRGQGIGEALTKAAIETATQRRVRSIDLTSRPSRVAANRLYRRLGFVGRDTNVYRLSL